jgi:hypothetical protein
MSRLGLPWRRWRSIGATQAIDGAVGDPYNPCGFGSLLRSLAAAPSRRANGHATPRRSQLPAPESQGPRYYPLGHPPPVAGPAPVVAEGRWQEHR